MIALLIVLRVSKKWHRDGNSRDTNPQIEETELKALKNKVATVLRSEHVGRELLHERSPKICRVPLGILAEYRSGQMCEETTQCWLFLSSKE